MGSYTAQEGNLTANIRMSSTITAGDKMMLEEYLANSPVVIEDKPSSDQPSTASLVEKGFRSRFVKEQVKVKEQYHRVSSLTNLIDSVQPGQAPVPNTSSASSSFTSSRKSKPKSKHSPTPSACSTHSTTGNDNSNNRPSPTRAATAPSPTYASSSTRRAKK